MGAGSGIEDASLAPTTPSRRLKQHSSWLLQLIIFIVQDHIREKMRTILLLLLGGLTVTSAFLRGYSNSRSWGTGPQRRVVPNFNQRQARQLFEAEMSSCASCKSELEGPVCGSDGRTYSSTCSLRQQPCKMMRRQGRSFQSSMLKIEQVHVGPCKPSCEGMEDLGAFKAFNLRATNNGLCVHDFFQCARKMRKSGAKRSQVQECCQARFNKCNRIV